MNNFNVNVSSFLKWQYSEEQLCAYFLSKNIQNIYQLDDDFIKNWYEKIMKIGLGEGVSGRQELILYYSNALIVERKYEGLLEYWVERYGRSILDDIEDFFNDKK